MRLLAAQADYREKLSGLGAEPAAVMILAQVNAFLAGEIKRWAKVAKDANIKVE